MLCWAFSNVGQVIIIIIIIIIIITIIIVIIIIITIFVCSFAGFSTEPIAWNRK